MPMKCSPFRLAATTEPCTPTPSLRGQPTDSDGIPNPRFRDYWPHVEDHLRFTTQDTGSVENYRVCWREVEALDDELFGNLGDLPLRSWTRATAIRSLAALADRRDGAPRSQSTLACKVNALAAVFRRASFDRHPITDEPLYARPNPFRNKQALLRELADSLSEEI